jgi:hypothetical protein
VINWVSDAPIAVEILLIAPPIDCLIALGFLALVPAARALAVSAAAVAAGRKPSAG